MCGGVGCPRQSGTTLPFSTGLWASKSRCPPGPCLLTPQLPTAAREAWDAGHSPLSACCGSIVPSPLGTCPQPPRRAETPTLVRGPLWARGERAVDVPQPAGTAGSGSQSRHAAAPPVSEDIATTRGKLSPAVQHLGRLTLPRARLSVRADYPQRCLRKQGSSRLPGDV